MYGLLLALMVLVGIFLGIVVLLQAGKGGGLAAMGGGSGTGDVLGGRQATTVLTRATWISGGVFMALALILSIMSSRAQAPQSILQPQAPVTSQPAPVLPGVTDQPPPTTDTPGGDTPPSEDPGNPGQ